MFNNPGNLFKHHALILVCPLILIVCCFTKTTSFVAANFFHCPELDWLFTHYTNLGDGIVVLILVVGYFLSKKRSLALKVLATFLLSGLAVQILKELFHAPRPKTFFTENFYRHFIEGVTHGGYASFPSGHTTTAFAVAAILSFNTNKTPVCIISFWAAALVGYSRIYLGQHFLEDVIAGIITGVTSSIIVEYFFNLYLTRIKAARKSTATVYEQPAAIGL
ncbi:MAG: phosphatase PAP2 family protein [Pseudobacter sp.]|uniref:phosphatase PAP2 family protein n=1 Tax=Pseudobacter sp. TaxID=2045420 RepID=UPI003F819A34